MAKLYLRNARLTVGTKKFNARFAFNVVKTTSGTSNKSKVSAYNLSEDSRSFIEKSKELMRFEAGYQDNLSLLFIGNIKKVVHTKSGPDIITTLECGDGEKQITESAIELSLGPGSKVSQVINAAKNALGVSVGVIKGLPDTAFQNGFSFSGTVADLLDKMAKKGNLVWSVQNNALQIFPANEDTGEDAVLLNVGTGLIGVPNKTDEGFVCRSLLNPELIPGRLVQIESKLLTGGGTFRIEKAEHTGDTQEGDWITDVEGKGLKV